MSKYRILPKISDYTRTDIVSAMYAILASDREEMFNCLDLMINKNHTKRELKSQIAVEENNLGFNKVDLPRMIRIYRKLGVQDMTSSDFSYLKKRIPHYAEQYILLLGKNKVSKLIKCYYGD